LAALFLRAFFFRDFFAMVDKRSARPEPGRRQTRTAEPAPIALGV
jgi:hypothetical protein